MSLSKKFKDYLRQLFFQKNKTKIKNKKLKSPTPNQTTQTQIVSTDIAAMQLTEEEVIGELNKVGARGGKGQRCHANTDGDHNFWVVIFSELVR